MLSPAPPAKALSIAARAKSDRIIGVVGGQAGQNPVGGTAEKVQQTVARDDHHVPGLQVGLVDRAVARSASGAQEPGGAPEAAGLAVPDQHRGRVAQGGGGQHVSR